MAAILLPQSFREQPRSAAALVNPDFWRLVDIQGFQPLGSAKATSTLQGTAKLGFGRAGRCVDFVVDGDWLSYGANPNLQLSTMTGLAALEVTSASTYTTIFNTNVSTPFSQGFMLRVDDTGTVTALKLDTVGLGTTTKSVKRGTGLSSVAWSYNNVSGLLRIAVDGTLQSFTSAQTFTHGTVGRNRYYSGDATQASAHKQYLFALSASDAVSNAQLIEWSRNPWSIFQAPARRIWAAASTDVTVALTGQALTSARGSFVPSNSVALSGQSVTSSRGTLSPSVGSTVALTGLGLTSARGSLSPALSIALSGQTLTGSQGTFTPGTAKALSGLSLTGSVGALSPATQIALTGQSLTSAKGTLSASGTASAALTGQALATGQGTLSPSSSSSVALTGQALVAARGALSPALAVTVSGQYVTASQGSVAPATAISLSGQSVTIAQGNLAIVGDVSIQLSGLQLSIDVGDLAASTGAISSVVERTAIFRATVARTTKFQRSKSVTVRFN